MRLLAAILAVFLAGCAAEPEPATPALWRIDGPQGERGYLFGTIHALERPALWRSAKVDDALRESNRVVVEVGNLADQVAMQQTFTALARSPGLPPVAMRVDPALRARLTEMISEAGAREGDFAELETWAVALTLARAGQTADAAENGVDRAVLAAAGERPVVELEGAGAQLGLFDALPEREQRDLLNAVLRDAGAIANESGDLAAAWRQGDMRAIEAETREGLLADPELRAALFTGRNRAWSEKLSAMLAKGEYPFIAVGAAHMAGPEGLPALMAAKGYRVTRVQ